MMLGIGLLVGAGVAGHYRCSNCGALFAGSEDLEGERVLSVRNYIDETRELDHNVIHGRNADMITKSNTIDVVSDRPAGGFIVDAEGIRGDAVYNVTRQKAQME